MHNKAPLNESEGSRPPRAGAAWRGQSGQSYVVEDDEASGGAISTINHKPHKQRCITVDSSTLSTTISTGACGRVVVRFTFERKGYSGFS